MRISLILLLTLSLLWGAKKEGSSLSMRTYKRLATVENLIEDKRFEEAGERLQRMLERMPRSSVDRAYIFNSAGMYHLQLEAYEKATTMFLQAYEENVLLPKQMLQLTELIGNLYMHTEEYARAILFYERYLQAMPDAEKRLVMACAVAYYQGEKFDKVITLLEKEKSRFEPDENLYRMLFASYYELKQRQEALSVLSQMISHWSHRREYWLQQSSLYYESEKPKKALESIELAYNRGVLKKEDDHLHYIYLLLEMQIPHKAGELLEQFIKEEKVSDSKKRQELLEQCHLYSREKEPD